MIHDVCDELIVCTDDGSAGIKGLVTKGIEQALAEATGGRGADVVKFWPLVALTLAIGAGVSIPDQPGRESPIRLDDFPCGMTGSGFARSTARNKQGNTDKKSALHLLGGATVIPRLIVPGRECAVKPRA